MQRMHTVSYGPSADYFRFHNYISTIPLTIPSCFIKKQRATMALCKPDEIVKGIMDNVNHQFSEPWNWSNHSEVILTE